ncbi:MAG: protein-L-isoaspartate(D-aspartate) O-methyltransferase, partial [Ilumatobacteraceae bacterium]
AYADRPLGIGAGQTISQPYIVALTIQALEPSESDTVLEVGTGSGYGAAVLSRCVARVVTVQRIPELAQRAEATCDALGYDNIEFCVGDGTLGWSAKAPYDGIAVTAAGPDVPETLEEQLAIGGRLVIPTGGRWEQRLVRVRRLAEDRYESDDLGGVAFVPLIGAQGW